MRLHLALTPLLVAASLGLAACGGGSSSASDDAATTSASTASTSSTSATTSTSTGTVGANTADVVSAANAFRESLSDDQRDKVDYDFGDSAVKSGWSNLPAALAPRNGVALGDMSSGAQRKALTLMRTALSTAGYDQLAELRTIDDYLAEQQQSGGGGGPGGGDDYGAGNFYLAIFGSPSDSGQWLLQYTGHHMTFNIGYDGDRVTFGPEFAGTEPKTVELSGKELAPLGDATDAITATLEAMSSSQRSEAELSQSYDDLLLGAQKDTGFPGEAEGVTVSELPEKAQDEITALIRAYVGDLGGDAAEAKIKAYVAAYDETKFAYSGGTDVTAQGFYARLDGPVAWIELSTQNGIVLQGTHFHSIYREQGSDYLGS